MECAFGIVKDRWRILSFIEAASVARVSKIIVACAVLHNFLRSTQIVEMNGTLTVEITETMDKTLMVM